MTRTSTTCAALLLLAGVAIGQDDDHPFVPPNEELDRELDESLQREYGPDGKPVERPYDTSPPPPPPPPSDADEEEDEWRVRLGGLAAHYYTWLRDARISHREGLSGGQTIRLDEDDLAEFDPENSQTYRAWIDFGRWISLEGGFRRTPYRTTTQSLPTGFTYGTTTFAAGSRLETELDLATIDADFVFKPVNNRWFELSLHFGARYIYAETMVRDLADSVNRTETQRVEMGIPMIGLGLALRPFTWFEIYARGRVGYFGYERDEAWLWDEEDDEYDHISPKEKSAASGELDAGIKIIVADTIGIVGGWRLDYLDIEREVTERDEGVRAYSHGFYGGLILQF